MHLSSPALCCYWFTKTWSVRKSVCPPGYHWHHPSEKQHLPLLSLIDSLGSVLRVPAQPDLLRQRLSAPQRHWVTIRSYFLSQQTVFIYSLSGRQWMQLSLTNNLMMQPSCQDRFFFLPVPPSSLYSPSLLNISVSCQSFFPSHTPCWHRNPSLLTWGSVGHVGGHYYSWGSAIHSVTLCQ